MPKQARKAKVKISPTRVREMLAEATGEQVNAIGYTPVMDPKLGHMFQNRLLTGDFEQTNFVEHRPLNIENSIIFDLKSDEEDFMDTTHMFLSMTTRIMQINNEGTLVPVPPPTRMRKLVEEARMVETKSERKTQDGRTIFVSKAEPITVEKEVLSGLAVTPQCGFGLTAFQSVKVWIGQQELPDTDRAMYHHKVMFRLFTEISPEVINAQLRSGLFYLDSDDTVDPFGSNIGLSKRYGLAGASLRYKSFSPLMLDSLGNFKQGNILPGGTPLKLEFIPAPAPIALTSNNPKLRFAIQFENPTLFVRYYKLSSAAKSQLMTQLSRSDLALEYVARFMDYKILQKNVKTFRFNFPSAEEDFLPDRVFFTFVTAKAWRGSLDTISTYYEPHGLSKLTIDIGDSSKRRVEIECDEERTNVGRLYWFNLLENNINFWTQTIKHMLPDDWTEKGRFGLMIDLTKNHSAGISGIKTVPQVSRMELILEFKEALEQDLVLLSLSYQDETLLLNKELLGRMAS